MVSLTGKFVEVAETGDDYDTFTVCCPPELTLIEIVELVEHLLAQATDPHLHSVLLRKSMWEIYTITDETDCRNAHYSVERVKAVFQQL